MSEAQPCFGAPLRRSRFRVLGTFEVCTTAGADATPTLTDDERRLLAVLAVAATPRATRSLSALLWPELDADLALGTLLGVRDSLGELVVEAEGTLVLADTVDVDLTRALTLLRAWQRDPFGMDEEPLAELVELLGRDLLPGWTEGWAAEERERFRRVRLHALGSACTRLTTLGRHELAVRTGALLVEAEPLSEDARRALIEAHLAAGNVAEAVHQYDQYVEACAKFGLPPAAEFNAFFPPSPAWPVLHVRRPIHGGGAVGRGLWLDPQVRRSQVGAGSPRA
jgi:DNA-binding SARP family transcriptional activator